MIVHVIGAGVAGMAAAMELRAAGMETCVWEAARHPGGRARSFRDARLGCEIDNGNHLMLAANAAVLRLAARLGADDALRLLPEARFALHDLARDRRLDFVVTPLVGPLSCIWFETRGGMNAPRIGPAEWLRIAALPFRAGGTVREALGHSDLWRLFWHPFALGVLNTDPAEAALAPLLRVLRETFLAGAQALRPVIANNGLSEAFARPFAAVAKQDGGLFLHTGAPVREVVCAGERATALLVGHGERRRRVPLSRRDAVILAVPPWEARRLLPWIMTPDDFRPIVNVHYRLSGDLVAKAAALAPFVGLVGGTAQWLFVRDDVLSVTVSDAGELVHRDGEDIARACWRDASRALGLPADGPPPVWRVIRERRATFACTPAQLHRRPPAESGLTNLFLAGDWTATGLPATLESAARSGERAARLALAAIA